MKVRVPMMVKDPAISADSKELVEGFDITREDFFLDGPVTRRVAVLDFDDKTGQLRKPVAFVPAASGRRLNTYAVDRTKLHSDAFIQSSVFATVLRTMYLFEDEATLGRKLTWAFDAPQLLIVPRAGQWENAFYERESHSLQFFYIPDPRNPKQTIYTCLSRDIVAHETGHAIIDGIAPDLHDNLSPQSLALHESIADLIALFMAFDSRKLREAVLEATGGSIEETSAFSSIAEQFGRALDPQGRAGYLRSLLNNRTLDPDDTSRDAIDVPNFVDPVEPHKLSEVLSGALYTIMVKIHKEKKAKYVEERGESDFSASGRALAVGAMEFKRMVLRGLDFLPPGEITFADLGRAMIAAEQTLYPDDPERRDWIREQFLKRRIVQTTSELDVETDQVYEGLQEVDLAVLTQSDWAAYEFANANRDYLQIPDDVRYFRVAPRLDVTRAFFDTDGIRQTRRECLFKVAWDQKEDNPKHLQHILAPQRQVTMGTTLVIDWHTKQIRARLSSDQSSRERQQRDRMVQWLFERGIMRVGAEATGPDGKPLRSVVRAETIDGLMRVRATARTLHIVQGD